MHHFLISHHRERKKQPEKKTLNPKPKENTDVTALSGTSLLYLGIPGQGVGQDGVDDFEHDPQKVGVDVQLRRLGPIP